MLRYKSHALKTKKKILIMMRLGKTGITGKMTQWKNCHVTLMNNSDIKQASTSNRMFMRRYYEANLSAFLAKLSVISSHDTS